MPDLERQRLEFLSGVAEKLGWYVYALRDPRNNELFYVGKGKGNRAYQHARAALKTRSPGSLKLRRIAEIHANGREVAVEIVRSGLRDEKTAFSVEAVVIDALTLGQPAELSNPIAGHGQRWSTLEQLRHLEAPRVDIPAELRPAVLIRPRRKYSEGGRGYAMSADELWKITRGGWPIRFRDYKYVFCVHDAIVRGVWRVTGWDPDETRWGRGRRAFLGEPAEDLWQKFHGGHVGHLLPPKGAQTAFTLLL